MTFAPKDDSPPPPSFAPLDPELAAIADIIAIIKGLPVDGRVRVMDYLSSRFKPGEFRP
jgi:hypothetical protein